MTDHPDSLVSARMARNPDSRRWFLAGYLSAEPPYRDRHPSDLLELADRILTVLNELEPDYEPDE